MFSYRDLSVYRKAFGLAMDIFELSKRFPVEERYELTDQLRRSSRSVCRCIGEAYRKRHYKKFFVSKSSDADMENTETMVSLEFAHACGYVGKDTYRELLNRSKEVGRLLNHMVVNPEKYLRTDMV